jgi:hypothetical protein
MIPTYLTILGRGIGLQCLSSLTVLYYFTVYCIVLVRLNYVRMIKVVSESVMWLRFLYCTLHTQCGVDFLIE